MLEKIETTSDVKINFNTHPFQVQIYSKLGFLPQKLIALSKNMHLFASNLADSCLIYLIYQKSIKQISFNNIVYIHFDKIRAQASMFFEGVITDNVSSLEYGILYLI